MVKFIKYCAGEQTKRAIKLGAPIYPTCYGDGFTKIKARKIQPFRVVLVHIFESL